MSIVSFIPSLIKYVADSWREAGIMGEKINMKRMPLFCDLVWSRFKYGAFFEDYYALEFYNLSGRKRKTFLTSKYNWNHLDRISTPEARETMNDKHKFAIKFSDFLGRKWIFVDGEMSDFNKFIDEHRKVIVKPYDGYEGKGIHIISSNDIKARKAFEKDVKSGNKFMVEQLLTQHEEMAKLNPDCINTIRVETMVDQRGVSHIINTVAIMGTKGGVTNNAHNGGIMCHVDIEGGFITGPARNPEGVNSYYHPDTHMPLPGFKIPMWEDVKAFALKMSQVEPKARYIGWDIAITPDGPVVIEGNTRPGHCTQACDMIGRWPLLKSMM